MNQKLTDITVILDRSGSMADVASDTIGGFNRFLADQKTVPAPAIFTLFQFDNEFETVIAAKDIHSVEPLTGKTFVPRGSTALLDAIAQAVNSTGHRLDAMPERDRPGRVIVVIITDGYENSSTKFSRPAVFELIKHQREKYAWEFVFLGADQDAIASGVSIGIAPANAMSYAKSAAGVSDSFQSLSSNAKIYRSCSVETMAFTAEDRKKQAEAGAHPESEITS